MHRFPFNAGSKFGAKTAASHQIHRPPNQFLKEELQVEVAVEARCRAELDEQVMRKALEQARQGRLHILGKVAETLGASRKDISQHAPRIITIKIKVRNQRDVPLEAWAAIITDAQSGQLLRAIGHDAGVELSETAPATGVPAGGVMEIGTYQPDSDFASGLRVHLEFAMWQDLVWQGFEVNQQRTLLNRERRAEEYEFFVGSLRTAAGLPAPQGVELLEARQREFRQGPLGRQSSGLQDQLEAWRQLATTAPQLLPGQLNVHAAALERSRTSLLRHRQK